MVYETDEQACAAAASLLGFAKRKVGCWAKQCNTWRIRQLMAVLEFALYVCRYDAGGDDGGLEEVPILVPAFLAQTVCANLQSWAIHAAAQGEIGQTVHYAPMATNLACSADVARRQRELKVHRRAATSRHNLPLVREAAGPANRNVEEQTQCSGVNIAGDLTGDSSSRRDASVAEASGVGCCNLRELGVSGADVRVDNASAAAASGNGGDRPSDAPLGGDLLVAPGSQAAASVLTPKPRPLTASPSTPPPLPAGQHGGLVRGDVSAARLHSIAEVHAHPLADPPAKKARELAQRHLSTEDGAQADFPAKTAREQTRLSLRARRDAQAEAARKREEGGKAVNGMMKQFHEKRAAEAAARQPAGVAPKPAQLHSCVPTASRSSAVRGPYEEHLADLRLARTAAASKSWIDDARVPPKGCSYADAARWFMRS